VAGPVAPHLFGTTDVPKVPVLQHGILFVRKNEENYKNKKELKSGMKCNEQ